MGMLDQLAQSQGFANEEELHALVAMVDLTDPDIQQAFKEWRSGDGSKDTLESILDKQEFGAKYTGGEPDKEASKDAHDQMKEPRARAERAEAEVTEVVDLLNASSLLKRALWLACYPSYNDRVK